jgi:hypothetical protein
LPHEERYVRSNVPNDIYEMELMGDNRFMVAVPISADMELKRRIMGAIKSHFHGSAVDPCIKKFGARWSISTPEELQLFVVATLRMMIASPPKLSGRSSRANLVRITLVFWLRKLPWSASSPPFDRLSS